MVAFGIMSYTPYRGNPRTSQEWAALARIANGDVDIGRETLRELFVLGLVERVLGRIRLSDHGRAVVALQDAMAE